MSCRGCRYGELDIDLEQPFRRASMYDLVRDATGTDFWELRADAAAFREAAEAAVPGVTRRHGADGAAVSPGRVINELFEELVEVTLDQVRGAVLKGGRVCSARHTAETVAETVCQVGGGGHTCALALVPLCCAPRVRVTWCVRALRPP